MRVEIRTQPQVHELDPLPALHRRLATDCFLEAGCAEGKAAILVQHPAKRRRRILLQGNTRMSLLL